MELKTDGLFDLTDEQIELSKLMYNGKVIKCLVAPYHSYIELESRIKYTPWTYLFPERDMSYKGTSALIRLLVEKDMLGDVLIVTSHMNIIQDMVDGCVRILTEDDEVVSCPCGTLAANIHTIRYDMLENASHQRTESKKPFFNESVNEIIETINSATSFTQDEYDKLLVRVELVGEEIIRYKLKEMLSGKLSDQATEITRLENELDKLKRRKEEIINTKKRRENENTN